MKRKALLIFLAIAMALPMVLAAQEDEGITHKNSLSTTLAVYGNGGVEAKEEYAHVIRIPFGGTGMLTQGNNMEIKPKVSLSPVAVTPGLDIVITPVAVLQFMAGGEIGSGWYFAPMKVNGVGTLVEPDEDDFGEDDFGANVYTTNAFSGFKWKLKVGGAFQFDTGAVIPGDWSHVVIRTYHEAYYQSLTSASNLEFWEYETGKDNLNGWKYYANYLLGYSTPALPILDMVACLFETETMLTNRTESTISEEGWASDFVDYKVAALINTQFNDSHGLATLIQFNAVPNWKEPNEIMTDLTADKLARPLREIDSTNAYKWQFYRVALVYTFSF